MNSSDLKSIEIPLEIPSTSTISEEKKRDEKMEQIEKVEEEEESETEDVKDGEEEEVEKEFEEDDLEDETEDQPTNAQQKKKTKQKIQKIKKRVEEDVPGCIPREDSIIQYIFRLFFLLLFLILVTVIFFLVFAAPPLGFGDDVLRILTNEKNPVIECFAASLAILLLLYLLDFTYWKGNWKWPRLILLMICGLGFSAAAILAGSRYPGTPIALYVLLFPGFIWLIQYTFFRYLDAHRFLLSISVALLILSVGTLTIWIIWIVWERFYWNDDTKVKLAEMADCDEYLECLNENEDLTECSVCLTGWFLWIAPFLASVNAFVWSVASWVLSQSVRSSDKPVTIALKIFLLLLCLSAIGIWVAASIAGAGIQVSNAVQMFVAVFVIVLSGVIVTTVGWKNLSAQLKKVPFIKKVKASFLSDWVKAIFVLLFSPIVPIYFFLSFINAWFRRHLPFGYHIDNDNERKLWLTLAAHQQMKNMSQWRWAQIFVKVIWIGLFYVIISVGVAKLVTLFLSWLNSAIESLDIALITFIFMVVGLIMFLLPPVPGVPVYLAGGIILAEQGEKNFGYWGAVFFACFICLIIKFMAIAMQQKLIGEQMGRSVSVRKLVNVNSIEIKAIRKILEVPGFTLAKVCILIGGPDWPTSVLTGILKLSLFQMLLGSTPIIFLIVPTVLAGAFLLRRNDGGSWESISSVTLAIAALVQLGALLAAMYYITKVAEKNEEELSAMENDKDVEEAEKRDTEKTKLYLARTNWFEDFPILMKINLILGAIMIGACCYILAFASSLAFESFDVTDTIDEKLDGNAINLIKVPLGYVCIGLCGGSIISLIIFKTWASYRIRTTPVGFVIPDNIKNLGESTDFGRTQDPIVHYLI